jgi:hypothetical protein
VGADTSIAIGADGLPVISYRDVTAGGLKVAKCVNVNCTGLNTITPVDNPANDVGHLSAIAIGADGFPVIAHRDWTAQTLRLVKCNNAACTGGTAITTVAADVNHRQLDIAIPADGRPVVSYTEVDGQLYDLHVLKCGNAACSSGNTDTLIDGSGIGDTSIAINADGLPVVSYGPSGLRVARCGNAACDAGNEISVLDKDVGVASSSIAVGSDGLLVIAYHDATNQSLKVAKCGSVGCN